MATEALKSTLVTFADQTPPDFTTKAGLRGRQTLVAVATIESTTGVTTGSTYRMVRVPSGAFIRTLEFASDDTGDTGDIEIGVYAQNGGDVVDANLFADLDLNAAALARASVVHDSGVFTIADINKPLWQAAGVSADPQTHYDIVITSTSTIETGGTMTIWVTYTI